MSHTPVLDESSQNLPWIAREQPELGPSEDENEAQVERAIGGCGMGDDAGRPTEPHRRRRSVNSSKSKKEERKRVNYYIMKKRTKSTRIRKKRGYQKTTQPRDPSVPTWWSAKPPSVNPNNTAFCVPPLLSPPPPFSLLLPQLPYPPSLSSPSPSPRH